MYGDTMATSSLTLETMSIPRESILYIMGDVCTHAGTRELLKEDGEAVEVEKPQVQRQKHQEERINVMRVGLCKFILA